MKVLITTGGGGHFSPALSVIQSLPKDWEVLVVGRKYAFEGDSALSLEYQTAKKLKIPFIPLTTGRVQRKFTRHTLPSLGRIPVGFYQALDVVRQYRPDVVLSFGGYVTVPVAFAAAILRIPVVVHEQTLRAGLANHIVSRLAKKVCVSWEESAQFFPRAKTVVTGNPIRKEFLNVIARRNDEAISSDKAGIAAVPLASRNDDKLPLIYITGGSAGAHALNQLVESSLDNLVEHARIIHQTGASSEFEDFERLLQKEKDLSPHLKGRYHAMKFIDPAEVASLFSRADLIISRSGINTVTEILYVGKPCLLIPLPYGQHNEQLENARFVEEVGLGKVALQDSLTPDSFYTEVQQMLHNKKTYARYAGAARKLIDVHAAEKIIDILAHVQEKKKTQKAT